ncbi:hypothetical protein HAX54_019842 [Datura stramonium]|uniref:Uncharacterized protein n=1 Tax=Datura stramonium TaxID=4076 RepID=A0ABS8USD7_DATST|nr:hypothetical protein [Datura stramonium]
MTKIKVKHQHEKSEGDEEGIAHSYEGAYQEDVENDTETINSFVPGRSNVSSLTHLDLSYSSFSGEIPSEISQLSKLQSLILSDYHTGQRLEPHNFKMLLKNLTQLRELDLTEVNISSTIPPNFSSHNNSEARNTGLHGILPESIFLLYKLASSNLIGNDQPSGHFPKTKWNSSASELDFLRSAKKLLDLDLSNNKIQGRIPDWAWSNWMHSMTYLNSSHNMLTMGRSSSVCNSTSLRVLDFGKKQFEGNTTVFGQCEDQQLEILDLQHNIPGNLQTTFSSESQLKSFNLHGNKLEGRIPRSLANCKELEVLDLGNNHLNDTFPVWLGTLPNLRVLSLRSNKLHGSIRTSSNAKLFPKLQMLDLSSNAFIAELPTSLFQNLKAMRRLDQTMKAPGDEGHMYYQDSGGCCNKGTGA